MLGIVLFLVGFFSVPVISQNLNVLPELFRQYVNEYPEVQTLNILGNVSDVIFSNGKYEASVNLGSYLYQSSYDFIIVGSGPAGCVLANRLSANPHWTVLLIEAGQPESVIQNIPLATTLTASSNYVRNYYFERNKGACLNIVDKECPYTTGVALGGSSVVNNFIYTRGNRHDFDKWQQMGNDGWGYDEVLPYFKKLEKRNFGNQAEDEDAKDGPLNIEYPRYTTGLLPVYLRAGQEMGQKVIDYNGESQLGIGIVQGTTLKGKRLSAAGAYINPIYQDRPNLHILTNTRALKILINSGDKTAYAVQYRNDGVRTVVNATKEIIISAGAVGSAHLLMLSGVGPKKVLEKANITVIEDLPVGQNLLTNIAVHAPHFIVNTSSLSIHIKRISINSFLQFQSGRGPLASYMGTEAISLIKTPFSDLVPSQPDVEIQFVSAGMQSDLGMGFRKTAQISEMAHESVFKPIESPEIDTWSTIVMNLHSNTKGRLKLVDNDINTNPIIEYPYFEDTRDLESIVYGIRQAMSFAQTKAFQSIGAKLHEVPLPNCSHLKMDTNEYWECYVRRMTQVASQMVATNKMGPDSDPEAVVDPLLRVRRINRLRIADTSIIPTTMSGHLQATSYLIGEKLADILKKNWKPVSNDIPSTKED